jgi:phage shock protein A
MLLYEAKNKQGGNVMGIFTRFRDIINSNINAMLDKAEDPEKLIKMMIHEMEDTLIEIKASCAGVMAGYKKIERQIGDVKRRISKWEENATLAVNKGRDDLAREALMEKRKYIERAATLERELEEHNVLISEYQNDIAQLEEKLNHAREKQRVLVQRHIYANGKKRAQQDIRRAESAEAMFKYDELESRIDRMEADAELINLGKRRTLEEELDNLAADEEIEKELKELKASQVKKDDNAE